MRGTVRFAWLEANPAKGFAAGVSLHSHTSHSREGLGDLPRWVSGVPILAWELRRLVRLYACRYGALPDFSAAYWTPPLRSAAAIDLEREAISSSLGLPAFVSLTDHDTIAAGLEAADFRTVQFPSSGRSRFARPTSISASTICRRRRRGESWRASPRTPHGRATTGCRN